MTTPPTRRHHAIPLLQAAEESPTLGRLLQLARESRERLKLVEFMIPRPLRPAVKAGPIEDDSWCLLVSGNAAAAKLRQVLPAMQAHLRSQGVQVGAIRLKVQPAGS